MSNPRRKLRSLLGMAILAGSVMPFSDVRAQETMAKARMNPEHLSRIPARMNEFLAANTIPGAVTLVARHGVVASLEAVGYQDWDTKTPMRTDSIFPIRSITKAITAVAIMILLEDGRLLLSDPVEKHLPEFRGQTINESRNGEETTEAKKPTRPITLRDLLTHTSGMGPLPQTGEPAAMSTLAQLVTLAARTPLEFEPGTKWAYSDAGFLTLGRVVEIVSKEPYEQFVADRILTPLGMADSFFFPPAEKRARIVAIHSFENGTWKTVSADLYPPGAKLASPAYGLHATASDIAAFCQMMLNRGVHQGRRLLSGSSIDVMTAVQTGNLQAGFLAGMGWGLGLEIVRERLGPLAVGSFGHGAASSSYAWADPAQDLIGVVLIVRPGAGHVRDTFMVMAEAAVAD